MNNIIDFCEASVRINARAANLRLVSVKAMYDQRFKRSVAMRSYDGIDGTLVARRRLRTQQTFVARSLNVTFSRIRRNDAPYPHNKVRNGRRV